ncbi:MAG: isoprenylcysteine carboxylmethyltransferase family protein [Spirochaetia bacterium]|jgi:protein-S-isoprenylcysteine O-methyltransferase Ste14|nr:isoprenylcysteine carboxylmethyltransferase family protein [Spirochaetia bacterium]
MDNKAKPLPFMGVGPIYVATVLFITVAATYVTVRDMVRAVSFGIFYPLIAILAVLLIATGIYIWTKAVFVSKIDRQIKHNRLVTSGIYAWVRNPIYTAFLFICTGTLLLCNNLLLLFLPFLYWLFLTLLMIHTEEKWLGKKFGKKYLDYKKQVNRCFPSKPHSK